MLDDGDKAPFVSHTRNWDKKLRFFRPNLIGDPTCSLIDQGSFFSFNTWIVTSDIKEDNVTWNEINLLSIQRVSFFSGFFIPFNFVIKIDFV
ncbi:hypothetical protein PGB90_002147 [Kerria lacca]